MQTKTRTNGRRKTTPDLMHIIGGSKRGPGRPPRPAQTAEQIADSLETHAKRLQEIANDLRGKV